MFITIAAAIGVGVIAGIAAIIIHDLVGNFRRVARLGRNAR
jgi:hypothetical protein